MTTTAVPTTTPPPAAPLPAAPPAPATGDHGSGDRGGVRFGATRRGLRVAWLPAPGPVTARLAFRVGTADERLPERGLTLLVTHLAHRFTDVVDAEPRHGSCASELEVAFTATGDEQDVRDRLVALCEGLASLGEVLPEEVSHEAGHLRDEADLRPPTTWDQLRTARHGLQGWGQLAADELAVPSADVPALTGWVARWFTAANAVLAVTGPQPPGWVLPLLSGDPAPAPAPQVLPLQLPARVEGPSGPVAVTALADDGAAARAGWWWLHHLVHEELRVRGLTAADVEVEVTAVGGGQVELALAVHAGADPAQDALHAVQDATARACSEAVPQAELARWTADLAADPAAADPATQLDDLARAWLLSGRSEPPADAPGELLREQAGALAPADVLDALRAALGTGLLQVPHDVAAPAGLPLAAVPDRAAPSGGTWVPVRGGAGRLVVGEDGVQVQHEDGATSAVLWDDAAAVLHRAGGARVVLGTAGAAVEVDPAAWADGPAAVEVLDACAPADLVVPLAGALAAEVPAPGGRRGRVLAALRALAATPVGRQRTARG